MFTATKDVILPTTVKSTLLKVWLPTSLLVNV